MPERIVSFARYVVRTTGLVVVIAVVFILGATSVFGSKPSLGMAALCAWVLASCVLSWPRLPDAWRSDPPTDRQIAYAEKLGIFVTPNMTKGQLSAMISQATGR